MTNETKDAPLPSGDIVPLVPMRNVVLFPHALAPIAVGRPASVAALQQAIASGGLLGIVLRRDAHDDQPRPRRAPRRRKRSAIARGITSAGTTSTPRGARSACEPAQRVHRVGVGRA